MALVRPPFGHVDRVIEQDIDIRSGGTTGGTSPSHSPPASPSKKTKIAQAEAALKLNASKPNARRSARTEQTAVQPAPGGMPSAETRTEPTTVHTDPNHPALPASITREQASILTNVQNVMAKTAQLSKNADGMEREIANALPTLKNQIASEEKTLNLQFHSGPEELWQVVRVVQRNLKIDVDVVPRCPDFKEQRCTEVENVLPVACPPHKASQIGRDIREGKYGNAFRGLWKDWQDVCYKGMRADMEKMTVTQFYQERLTSREAMQENGFAPGWNGDLKFMGEILSAHMFYRLYVIEKQMSAASKMRDWLLTINDKRLAGLALQTLGSAILDLPVGPVSIRLQAIDRLRPFSIRLQDIDRLRRVRQGPELIFPTGTTHAATETLGRLQIVLAYETYRMSILNQPMAVPGRMPAETMYVL